MLIEFPQHSPGAQDTPNEYTRHMGILVEPTKGSCDLRQKQSSAPVPWMPMSINQKSYLINSEIIITAFRYLMELSCCLKFCVQDKVKVRLEFAVMIGGKRARNFIAWQADQESNKRFLLHNFLH